MAKYKVLIPFYKLSEAKNYNESDEIELSKEDAKELIKEGYLAGNKETKEEKEPYSKSKDGTKGIVLKKSIELVDKEIRELNDKL